MPKSMAEHFWASAVITAGCWEWTGRKMRGYGRFSLWDVPTKRARTISAHRASWMLHNGPIPKGMSVLHSCDNPECTNPEHLFLGDQGANMKDMASKRRGKNQNSGTSRCVHGHPFNEINTGMYSNGKRYCRSCKGATLIAASLMAEEVK